MRIFAPVFAFLILARSFAGDARDVALDLGGGTKLELVYVAASEFMMGADDASAGRSEKPAHAVKLTRNYYIGKYPTTVAQFRRFVNATAYKTDAEKVKKGFTLDNKEWKYDNIPNNEKSPYNANGDMVSPITTKWRYVEGPTWKNPGFTQGDDHPVVMVSWNDAMEFVKWASKQSGRNVTLPTEAQWEYAARGPESMKYPWGNEWDGTKANCADVALKESGKGGEGWTYSDERDGFVYTSPVGYFKNASWCGALDLSGNVQQLCLDTWDEKFYLTAKSRSIDPVSQGNLPNPLLKGSSWADLPSRCRASSRAWTYPEFQFADLGFRVLVADAPRASR